MEWQGEIDILEGINDHGPNRASLHTLPGIHCPLLSATLRRNFVQDARCRLSGSRQGTHQVLWHKFWAINLIYFSFWRQSGGLDCDATVNGNAGCSVVFPTDQSYGPPLNEDGGGWYVICNKQLQRRLKLNFQVCHRTHWFPHNYLVLVSM